MCGTDQVPGGTLPGMAGKSANETGRNARRLPEEQSRGGGKLMAQLNKHIENLEKTGS